MGFPKKGDEIGLTKGEEMSILGEESKPHPPTPNPNLVKVFNFKIFSLLAKIRQPSGPFSLLLPFFHLTHNLLSYPSDLKNKMTEKDLEFKDTQASSCLKISQNL